MNLKLLTKPLGIEPTRSWQKGEEHVVKSFDPEKEQVIAKWSNSVWAIESEIFVQSKKVSDHLAYLDGLLTPKYTVIEELLKNKDLFIRLSVIKKSCADCCDYEVDPELLIRCCKLCHEVSFANLFFMDSDPPQDDCGE